MNAAKTFDVAVIGGGTFGLFTCLTLAAAGKSVVLIDRGEVWREASAVNAGTLAVQSKLPPLVPYSLWSLDIWKSLESRLGSEIGLRRVGGYKIAFSGNEVARLDQVTAEHAALGFVVRRIDAAALREEAPWISHEVIAATYSERDSFASPTRLGPVLRDAVAKAGIHVVEHAEVVALHTQGALRVETSRETFKALTIAITAGAWSAGVASMAGVALPMSLDVNMVSVTEPAPRTVPQVVTHARGILTLKQVSNGSCLIGGGWQGIGDLVDRRKEIDYDQLVHNLRLAMRAIPGLARLNVLRSWAGYEGVTPDSLPYLGRLPGHADIYIAACARGGFTLGPLMGQLLGELIATGTTSRPIAIFNPGRFTNG